MMEFLDMFGTLPNGKSPKRVLVTGVEGIGKTTLIQKHVYEWAKTENREYTFTSSQIYFIEYISKLKIPVWNYELILYIALTTVRENATFCDTVHENLFQHAAIDKKLLCDYLQRKRQQLIIIFDDIDYYNESFSPEITEIMHKKFYQSALVIMTNRPMNNSQLINRKKLDVIYNLYGFGSEFDFIIRYFYGNIGKMEKLKRELNEKSMLDKQLLRIPMIAHFICYLWQDTNSLPKTTTDLYHKLIHYYLGKNKKSSIVTDVDNTKEQLSYLAMFNSNITWLKLYPPRDRTFSLKDLENSELLRHSGLVSMWSANRMQSLQEQSFSIKNARFIHKSFQQYFVVSYVIKHRYAVVFLKMLFSSILKHSYSRLFEEYSFLHNFMCGMTKSVEQLKNIVMLYHEYHDLCIKNEYTLCSMAGHIRLGLDRCLIEGKKFKRLSSLVTQLSFELLPLEAFVYTILPQHIENSSAIVSMRCKTVGDNFNLADYFAECLKHFSGLKWLRVGSFKRTSYSQVNSQSHLELEIPTSDFDSENHMKPILKQIRKLDNLQALQFSDVSLKSWGYILRDTLCAIGPHLKTLTISNTHMNEKDWAYFSQANKYLQNITEIEIGGNHFDSYPLFENFNFSKIHTLSLVKSFFSPRSYDQLMLTFRRLTTLKNLKMSGDNIAKGREHKLKKLKYLHSLREIKFNDITSAAALVVFNAIKNLTQVNLISISWKNTPSGDENFQMLADSISEWNCKQFYNNNLVCEEVVIKGNNFIIKRKCIIYYTTEDNKLLSNKVASRAVPVYGIDTLYLKTNYITNDGLKALAEVFYKLADCGISRLEIHVTEFPELKFLYFASQLIHLSELNKLSISGLSVQDTHKLVHNLKYLTALTELTLENNQLGDFVPEFINGPLKKLNGIRLLDFTNSTFSNESLLHLDDLIFKAGLRIHVNVHCYGTNTIFILKDVEQVTNNFALRLSETLCRDFEEHYEETNEKMKVQLLFSRDTWEFVSERLEYTCKEHVRVDYL